MKAIFTSLLLLASSTSAFAFSAEELALAMADKNVQAELAEKNIASIAHAPAGRCGGCFALTITVEEEEGGKAVYGVRGVNFPGREGVSIRKMEE